MDAQVAERRRRQVELYGDSVDVLARKAQQVLGLDVPALADVIGLSVPVLGTLVDGERVRAGDPVAVGRLTRLRELADRLVAGQAGPDDIPLTLARIRASSTGPARGARLPPGEVSLTASALSRARTVVGRHVRPTPTYRWPLLERLTRTETWVKHENHTPTGAFKVRGGLNLVERLTVSGLQPAGLISATRGNHGQSLAFAGRAAGIPVTIVVPQGNSPDKNQAMQAFGADLVVHGRDFDEAREYAAGLAAERDLMFVPSFHPWLVEGVATYVMELFEALPALDVLYVPIGLGSGICAAVAVRDLLGRHTEIVGVVAERAPAYALSFEAGEPVPTETAETVADGVAVRTPDPVAVAIIRRGVSRVVQVSEEQVLEAMGVTWRATHNLAEPAGSIALAGLLADLENVVGKQVCVVQTGGNCDFELAARALA